MKAGPLNTRLTLFRPLTADATGVITPGVTGWEEAGSVAAERVKFAGSARSENNEAWADYTASFRIRMSRRAIAEGWRVRERGDSENMLYQVTNILHDRALGMTTLQCVRVNL